MLVIKKIEIWSERNLIPKENLTSGVGRIIEYRKKLHAQSQKPFPEDYAAVIFNMLVVFS